MARSSPIINAFNAGELSPKMYGRTDFAKYHTGCKTLQNAIALPQGGATMRPGTYYVADVKTHAKKVRLFPFEFSILQAYMLEFGHEYLRFYMDQGQIESGGSPYEIATTYQEEDLFSLKFAQSADVLYIVHNDYPVRKLTRTGHTAWTLSTVVFRAPATSEQPVYPATTLTPGATTGTGVTFTAGAAYFLTGDVGRQILSGSARAVITAVGASPQPITTCTADILDAFPSTAAIASGSWRLTGSPTGTLTPSIKDPEGAIATLTSSLNSFRSGDVGKYVQINGGFLLVTAFTSATAVSAQILRTLTTTTGSTVWSLEAEDWNSTDGYPSAVSFYEGRLWFGRNLYVWGSVIEDYENFAKGSDDDASVKYTLLSNQVNAIRWIEQGRHLAAGTVGGEWSVKSASDTDPITPTSIDAKRESTHGCADIRPLAIGSSILFMQRAGRKLRELTYTYETDGYVAPDLTRIADHITRGGITDIAYQQEPHSIIYLVRADGVLLCLTYERAEDVVAWARFVTDGEIESVGVLPATDEYEVYVAVKRTINGAEKRYVEILKPFDFGGDLENAFFLDSGLTYDGAATDTITGLDHLEGETVGVLADGAVHPDCTVTSGSITLNRTASKVHVGLKYEAIIEPMPFDSGSATGSGQGKKQRIHKATVRLLESLGCKVGYDTDHMETVYFRTSADLMGQPPAIFTGDKAVVFPKGWDKEAKIRIVQDQPLPLTVTAVVAEMETNE